MDRQIPLCRPMHYFYEDKDVKLPNETRELLVKLIENERWPDFHEEFDIAVQRRLRELDVEFMSER